MAVHYFATFDKLAAIFYLKKKFKKKVSKKVFFQSFLAIMVPRPIWSMPAKIIFFFLGGGAIYTVRGIKICS
jgi:hypothetical protein